MPKASEAPPLEGPEGEDLSRDQRRSRRKRAVRATTENIGRIPKHKLALYRELYPYPEGVARPKTRADCAEGARPCPFVSCAWNLYLDVLPRTGAIKYNFPDLEPDQMPPGRSCALDVADSGPHTLERVGEVLNVTRERLRQIEVRALAAAKGNADERVRDYVDGADDDAERTHARVRLYAGDARQPVQRADEQEDERPRGAARRRRGESIAPEDALSARVDIAYTRALNYRAAGLTADVLPRQEGAPFVAVGHCIGDPDAEPAVPPEVAADAPAAQNAVEDVAGAERARARAVVDTWLGHEVELAAARARARAAADAHRVEETEADVAAQAPVRPERPRRAVAPPSVPLAPKAVRRQSVLHRDAGGPPERPARAAPRAAAGIKRALDAVLTAAAGDILRRSRGGTGAPR